MIGQKNKTVLVATPASPGQSKTASDKECAQRMNKPGSRRRSSTISSHDFANTARTIGFHFFSFGRHAAWYSPAVSPLPPVPLSPFFPRATRVALVDLESYCELTIRKESCRRRYSRHRGRPTVFAAAAAARSWRLVRWVAKPKLAFRGAWMESHPGFQRCFRSLRVCATLCRPDWDDCGLLLQRLTAHGTPDNSPNTLLTPLLLIDRIQE